MYYVYLLKDKRNNKPYIGYSSNVAQRLKEHQKSNKDFELIYYEAYQYEKDARIRERKLKMYGSAWRGLKQRLRISLNN